MPGMDFRNMRARQSLRLAVVFSLLLHAAVLLIGISSSDRNAGPVGKSGTRTAWPRLVATLSKPAAAPPPAAPAPASAARKPAGASRKAPAHPILSTPTGPWAARAWSRQERTDMDKFLNEPAPPAVLARPLSERALAMARQLARTPQDDDEEAPGAPTANGKPVDRYSLEMYFDAFVRKMNRSAAFVKNAPRTQGNRKALVQIALNPDGSLKSYRILRAADQQAEIAYIRSVLDRAAPFSAFPADIRDATDALTIQMCIYPPTANGSGGFSRSFGGQDCKD